MANQRHSIVAVLAFSFIYATLLIAQQPSQPSSFTLFYSGRAASVLFCVIVVLIVRRVIIDAHRVFQVGLGATVVYLAFLCLQVFFDAATPESVLIAFDALSGVFNGIRIIGILLVLGHALSSFSSGQAAVLIPIGYAGAHGIFLVTYIIPLQFFSTFQFILIALATLWVFILHMYTSPPKTRFRSRVRDESLSLSSLLKKQEMIPLFLGMLVFPLFYGLMSQICLDEGVNLGLFDTISETGVIITMLLLAVSMPFLTTRLDQVATFSVVAAVYAVAFLLSTIFWGSEVFVSGLLIKYGYLVFLALMWISLQRITNRAPDKSFLFFGIALGIYQFTSAAGRLTAHLLNAFVHLSEDLIVFVSIIALWVIAMAALGIPLLSRYRSKKDPQKETPAGMDFEGACAQFAQTYGLSSREKETILEFARGRTVKRIAEDLLVSEESVKSYIKRSYAKSTCHSRQDIIDKIEQIQAGPSQLTPPPPPKIGRGKVRFLIKEMLYCVHKRSSPLTRAQGALP